MKIDAGCSEFLGALVQVCGVDGSPRWVGEPELG
jgi:hypothetical protein